MAVITKITTQKKNTERFNVYIDQGAGEEYAFSVDADILIAYKLNKGMTIDAKEMTTILHDDAIKKGFNQALRFLSFRMRSQQEIADLLKKQEYSEEAIAAILQKLAQYGYVNDEEFAKMLVRTKKNTSNKGPVIISRELLQKGVSERIVQVALSEYSWQEQVDTAAAFAEKKAAQTKGQSQHERKNKVMLQLLQKGFSKEVINEAMTAVDFEMSHSEEREALIKQATKAHKRYKKFSGMQYTMKMKQHLYGKGFPIALIEEVLNSGVIDQ
ncbi:recombination regulator RecX [Fictibacillus macauensis ZFHKF-1]|uniref:Regulatory protein RecX n=1 Tax=Fictibacillus macauensis ZFHKF-1 TaxID=1196324 RepID=I8UCM2_9BACL|nr:recombination regulator RecX [Fictibacillus macauensis]EIT84675.1 recombination regulator RecX [Fictibacillus macauensis ZFHKF-1]